MTFLELCQMTAQQSGTIQGVKPTTVVGQADRLKQVVDFVREAYVDIQNAHRMWRWLNSEFFGTTEVGVNKYSAADFYDEQSETLVGTRFSQWGFKNDGSDTSTSMYLSSRMNFTAGLDVATVPGTNFEVGATLKGGTSKATATVTRQVKTSGTWFDGSTFVGTAAGFFEVTDVSGTFRVNELVGVPNTFFTGFTLGTFTINSGAREEGALRWLDWDVFYNKQLRGVQTRGKPQFYSIDNQNRMVLSPTPDAVYTLRGKYRKTPQYLAADGDIPEMPPEFHTIIKDAALCYIEGFDEGPRIPVYRLRMLPNFSMLEMHQLPKVSWGAPLA